jgi:hypothetical protein
MTAAAPAPNQTISDFLTYYTAPERKLDYAVMVDGPWGSGKTHLIRKMLEQHKADGGEHLYVSLYGITSVKQIEEEFYRLLHPVLSSKGMRLAGVLVRGAVKGLLKVDLTKEAHESVTFGLPEIKLDEYLNGPSKHLLVFDDLERCMMDVSDVMGYINSFVEHDGMKVIIIGNETEIVKGCSTFPAIKEKLIGQTLRITSDVATAYPAFLSEVSDISARKYLASHRDAVLKTHKQAGTDNLRVLKQSMWDFERLWGHLSPEHLEHKEGVLALLRLSLALSMEIRAGRLLPEQFSALKADALMRQIRAEHKDGPGIDEDFERRYDGITLLDPPFQPDLLAQIIHEGLSNRTLVHDTLAQNRHFVTAEQIPAWQRAWRLFDSEEADYNDALTELLDQWDRRVEKSPHHLYHIFGILLMASRIGTIARSEAAIVAEGKAYIADIESDGSIVTALEINPDTDAVAAPGGLSYVEGRSREFSDFVEEFTASSHRAAQRAYLQCALDTLAIIEDDPDEFLCVLSPNLVKDPKYGELPVLAALPAAAFVDWLLTLSSRNQTIAFRTLKKRYESGDLSSILAPEKPWLSAVDAILTARLPTLSPFAFYRLTSLVASGIKPALRRS